MIKALSLRNYRAFSELDVPLTKINLFFGPNNSGKSAIVSGLTLLAQTLASADERVPLLLNGKFEDLGTYSDAVHRNNLSADIGLALVLPVEDLPAKDGKPQDAKIDVTFHYRPQRKQTVIQSVELRCPTDHVILRTRVAQTTDSQVIEEVGPDYEGVVAGSRSSGDIQLDHFLPVLSPRKHRRLYTRRQRQGTSGYRHLAYDLYSASAAVQEALNTVEFIGPFRKPPQRVYVFSGEAPSSVGLHGDKVFDVLAADEARRRRKRLELLHSISQWFQGAEMARGIRVAAISDRHFEMRMSHFMTGEDENLADVGYGCSQILPILVAGFQRPKGSLLVLEQPEIHLHPKAQSEVGTFLLNVSNRDIQLIVETHSVHLLLRLQSHVAARDLAPSDINVFYVYGDPTTGEKRCEQLPLGQDGYFTKEWPHGFFLERLEEAERLARFGG